MYLPRGRLFSPPYADPQDGCPDPTAGTTAPCPASQGGLSITPLPSTSIDLIADGIADPRNVPALLACAALFQTNCFFHDPHRSVAAINGLLPASSLAALRSAYDVLIAIDTGSGAGNLFTYRPPPGQRMAILVGNERRGLSPATLRAADILLQIPMRPPAGQSLNVAAAAAVALSRLCRAGRKQRSHPHLTRRPDLVLLHPTDPAELGSTLRSAWALGWDHVYLADRHEVWFSRDRATYVQGRGAARRHKNPLQVRPYDSVRLAPYDLGLVVTLRGPGPPLAQVRLPPGAPVVVVLPDESRGAPGCDAAGTTQIARRVQYARLDVPNPAALYHYRLTTAMVLAELARPQA